MLRNLITTYTKLRYFELGLSQMKQSNSPWGHWRIECIRLNRLSPGFMVVKWTLYCGITRKPYSAFLTCQNIRKNMILEIQNNTIVVSLKMGREDLFAIEYTWDWSVKIFCLFLSAFQIANTNYIECFIDIKIMIVTTWLYLNYKS